MFGELAQVNSHLMGCIIHEPERGCNENCTVFLRGRCPHTEEVIRRRNDERMAVNIDQLIGVAS